MTRHILHVDCPCCGQSLEIDTRTGKARRHAGKDAGLDDLVAKQRKESQRLDDLFHGAKSAERERDSEFDRLLEDAKEKSKNDKDKPRSPFDLE
ncbi:MAG: hypothetical protein U1F36_12590 [Planctomycetota bacterium]